MYIDCLLIDLQDVAITLVFSYHRQVASTWQTNNAKCHPSTRQMMLYTQLVCWGYPARWQKDWPVNSHLHQTKTFQLLHMHQKKPPIHPNLHRMIPGSIPKTGHQVRIEAMKVDQRAEVQLADRKEDQAAGV